MPLASHITYLLEPKSAQTL